MNFSISLSIGTVLNVQINLDRIDTLMLSLPMRDYDISFQLFSSLIFLIKVLWFSACKSRTYFVRFTLRVFCGVLHILRNATKFAK